MRPMRRRSARRSRGRPCALSGSSRPKQQSVMMLHRVRLMLNRQRTQLSNALRAHLAEFGIVAPIGRARHRPASGRHRRCCRRPAAGRCAAMSQDAGRAAEHREGADPRERPADHGQCAQHRTWSPADGDTRRGPATGQRDRGERRRPSNLQARAATWQPGSGWYRGRTPAAGRSGSAA